MDGPLERPAHSSIHSKDDLTLELESVFGSFSADLLRCSAGCSEGLAHFFRPSPNRFFSSALPHLSAQFVESVSEHPIRCLDLVLTVRLVTASDLFHNILFGSGQMLVEHLNLFFKLQRLLWSTLEGLSLWFQRAL
jgi:hypothetical protein